jgi:hypothetical protein
VEAPSATARSASGRLARVTSSGTANDLYSELRSDAVARVTRMIASAAQVEWREGRAAFRFR